MMDKNKGKLKREKQKLERNMPIDELLRRKLFRNKSDEQIEKEVHKIMERRKRKTLSLSKGINFLVKNKRGAGKEVELRKELIRKRSYEMIFKLKKAKANKQFMTLEYEKKKKFLMLKREVLFNMKRGLVDGLLQKRTVEEFWKAWITQVTLIKICRFLNKWKKLEVNRSKKVRKMLTVTYILTLAYKKKAQQQGKDIDERLRLHSFQYHNRLILAQCPSWHTPPTKKQSKRREE